MENRKVRDIIAVWHLKYNLHPSQVADICQISIKEMRGLLDDVIGTREFRERCHGYTMPGEGHCVSCGIKVFESEEEVPETLHKIHNGKKVIHSRRIFTWEHYSSQDGMCPYCCERVNKIRQEKDWESLMAEDGWQSGFIPGTWIHRTGIMFDEETPLKAHFQTSGQYHKATMTSPRTQK